MSDKNQNIIRRIISNLNIKDFSTFSLELMRNTYKDHINYYDKIGFEAFIRDLPMGDLGDTFYDSGFKGIYIVDDSPYDMLTNMDKLNIESPKLIEKLNIVKHDFKDKYFQPGPDQIVQNNLNAIYFLTNLSGYDENFYIDKLIPKYYDLIKKTGIDLISDDHIGLCNIDSFLDFHPSYVDKTLDRLLQNNNSLAISLTGNIGSIKNLNSENYLRAGTGGNSHNLFYPQFSDPNIHKNETIKEFQDLITSNPTENKLEKFIEKYFQEIFGSKYDRIETQLLLNFPELDINDKTRKLDVFLHNSISSDWELFELKKVIPLTKTYRDIQTLSSEIYSSIQQIKNYERLLKQNQIKESLKKDGIEYFEPNLHLVVGRTPIISTEKWRWLVNSNGDVKIITYDDLIEEMKIRQKDRIDYYHSVQIIDDKK